MKNKQKAQGLVEYALILVLVAIVVIAVLMLLGPIIGNTFSTINCGLADDRFDSDCPTSNGSSGESGEKTFSSLTLNAKEAGRESLENYEAFQEEVFQQDEIIIEVRTLSIEAFGESMEVLGETAEEIGDQVSYDLIAQLQEEADAGNYETILAILSGAPSVFNDLPADVQVAIILKTEPLLVDSIQELQDAQVSEESFNAALAEIGALGDAEKFNLMLYLWSLVEDRNTIIGEILPAFVAAACFNADVLISTGDLGNVELGEYYKTEIGSCP